MASFSSLLRFKPTLPDKKGVMKSITPGIQKAANGKFLEVFEYMETTVNSLLSEADEYYEALEKKATFLFYGYVGIHSFLFSKIADIFSEASAIFLAVLVIFEMLAWYNLYKSLHLASYPTVNPDEIFKVEANPLKYRAQMLQHKWLLVAYGRASNRFKGDVLTNAQILLVILVMLLLGIYMMEV